MARSITQRGGGNFPGTAESISSQVQHPRGGYTWADLPAGHQELALNAAEGLGAGGGEAIRQHIASAAEEMGASMAGMKSVPGKLRQQHEVLTRGLAAASDIGETGMDASIARIKAAAMLPIQAQRKITQRGGDLEAPSAGDYYAQRHNIGKTIGEHTFGAGTEGAARSMLAVPTLSSRTPPQIEVAGGAGLSAIMKGMGEIGVTLGPHSARYLNEEMRGRNKNVEIPEGPQSLGSIARVDPQAAALLLQHGASQHDIVNSKQTNPEKLSKGKQARDAAMQSDARISLPPGLHEPTGAFISSLGVTGFSKGGRSIARFLGAPSDYGGSDFHKIPSYTWNIHQAGSDVMQKGTHHYLGALTHGDRWFQAHPDAETHIRNAMAHPAWSDPTSTQDVWAGRLASGLHPHVAMALGENTNPENMMAFAGLSGVKKAKGHPLGKTSDLGYLYQEEAHRRAGAALSVKLPSGGRATAPGHVVQSLAWFGVQGQAFPEMLKGSRGQPAARTFTPSSMSDPRGLNPLTLPKMWS